MPMIVLILVGIAVSIHAGRAGPENAGPHGFTEILYALTSQGNNNGSAFGGLTGDTDLLQRHRRRRHAHRPLRHHDPGPGPRRVLAAKNVVPESLGTFRTDNGMFVGLTIGVIVIIGGLTFFPAVALGPIVEQLSHGSSSDDHIQRERDSVNETPDTLPPTTAQPRRRPR
jgi:K+-transporting ATPase ATPase A chain